ncbi:MAG: hypothetical protein LCH53_06690 [Bacteroidetes bacterium]|nr:hypothetical protein [Bacteroidota bacterium]
MVAYKMREAKVKSTSRNAASHAAAPVVGDDLLGGGAACRADALLSVSILLTIRDAKSKRKAMDWPLVRRAQRILEDAGLTVSVDEQDSTMSVEMDGRPVTFFLAPGEYDPFTGRYTNYYPTNGIPLQRWLTVEPEITREGQQQLQDMGMNHIDGVGNAWLRAPGFFVRLTGKTVRPVAKRSGFSASEVRLVMGLLASSELREATVRELAAWARVSQKTVAKTFDRLEAKGYLERTGQTVTARRYWTCLPDLLEEWCQAYTSVLLSRRSAPARFRLRDGSEWRALPVENAGGEWGEAAATDLLQVGALVVSSPLLYTAAATSTLVQTLGLLPDDAGAVRVRSPFWGEMPPDSMVGVKAKVAPLPVVYADLRALRDARATEAAYEVKRLWESLL